MIIVNVTHKRLLTIIINQHEKTETARHQLRCRRRRRGADTYMRLQREARPHRAAKRTAILLLNTVTAADPGEIIILS